MRIPPHRGDTTGVHAHDFDEGEFFRAIAESGALALLIGRRAWSKPAADEIHVIVPDVPSGEEVEVIVLAEAPPTPARIVPKLEGSPREALRRRFPEDTGLGPVVSHDDPCAPLPEEDWPRDLRS